MVSLSCSLVIAFSGCNSSSQTNSQTVATTQVSSSSSIDTKSKCDVSLDGNWSTLEVGTIECLTDGVKTIEEINSSSVVNLVKLQSSSNNQIKSDNTDSDANSFEIEYYEYIVNSIKRVVKLNKNDCSIAISGGVVDRNSSIFNMQGYSTNLITDSYTATGYLNDITKEMNLNSKIDLNLSVINSNTLATMANKTCYGSGGIWFGRGSE